MTRPKGATYARHRIASFVVTSATEGTAMIVRDASAIPLPGKQAELIAVVKEAVAYLDQHAPVASPRMVTADLIDGRVHLLTQRASLAEHEAAIADTEADAGFQVFSQKILALAVPGYWRWAYSRVV